MVTELGFGALWHRVLDYILISVSPWSPPPCILLNHLLHGAMVAIRHCARLRQMFVVPVRQPLTPSVRQSRRQGPQTLPVWSFTPPLTSPFAKSSIREALLQVGPVLKDAKLDNSDLAPNSHASSDVEPTRKFPSPPPTDFHAPTAEEESDEEAAAASTQGGLDLASGSEEDIADGTGIVKSSAWGCAACNIPSFTRGADWRRHKRSMGHCRRFNIPTPEVFSCLCKRRFSRKDALKVSPMLPCKLKHVIETSKG